jgi:hypothetical protein
MVSVPWVITTPSASEADVIAAPILSQWAGVSLRTVDRHQIDDLHVEP